MAILSSWLQFAQPGLLAITLPLWAATLLGGLRPVAADRAGRVLVAAGLFLVATAAGGPRVGWTHRGTVAVMVDLSASTRGANYRRRDWLDHRLATLLGNNPYQVSAFADGSFPLPAGPVLPDLPSDCTRFTPPPAGVVLLLSDGRFDLPPPTAARVYAVIDPGLQHPLDGAIEQLDVRDGLAIVAVRMSGPPRTLEMNGASQPITRSQRLAGPGVQPGDQFTARLSPGDLWPENDALLAVAPPPPLLQRWWVGDRDPGAGWTRLDPANLPADPLAFLNASVVVLDDLPGNVLSPAQSIALQQFVHDEGGGLVVLGGRHAFEPATANPTLQQITPLTPSPPTPTQRWIVLADGSGSMAGPAWEKQADAIRQLLPQLPPADEVRVGSFARVVQWWCDPQSAGALLTRPLPPPGVTPFGPTELAAALQEAVAAATDKTPTQLLLITDADTTLDAPGALQQSMLLHQVQLSVLAVGDGAALPALRQIATTTGGAVVRAVEPSLWGAAGLRLVEARLKPAARTDDVIVQPGALHTHTWERTWLRDRATASATSGQIPMEAEWAVGVGRVAAAALTMPTADAHRIADGVAAAAADLRYTVVCTPGPVLAISVDAADARGYLNGKAVQLSLSEPGGPVRTAVIPQTAPGRYEIRLPAPRRAVLASVSVDGQVVGRFPVAGRYAAEFDSVGNDPAALAALAARSGGAVIQPEDDRPIHFTWPLVWHPLTAQLALAAAALLLAGLVWRRRVVVTRPRG